MSSLFDQRRTPPTPNTNNAPETEDSVRENLDLLKAAGDALRGSDEPFASNLVGPVDAALKVGVEARAAHFAAADAQEKIQKGVEKGVDAAASYQGGPREAPKIDRAAVLRDAAASSAKEAVSALGASVFGGPGEPSLAQRAASAGLEAAVTRAATKWRAGVGRVEQLDDVVAGARLQSILKSKVSGEIHAFVQAMLSDPELDDRLWARLDLAAREIAVEMLAKQPVRDRARPRVSSGDGGAFAIGRKILDALDAEVERRTPEPIRTASDALDAYRAVFKMLVAPNSSFMSREEYSQMRAAGDRGLARMLASWEIDPGCWGRFLAPRSFRLPGWSPVSHTDRQTGKTVRKPK
jgi:hypothetical protein